MKILIWYKNKKLKPIGGPCGYLYNLNKYFIKKKSEVYFIDSYKINIFYRLYTALQKLLINKISLFYLNETEKKLFAFIKVEERKNPKWLNQFDIIHFHSSKKLFRNMNSLKKINSIIVLTSHSPQLLYEEEYQMNVNFFQKFSEETLNKYKEYEYTAFNKADYIIFPCKEAMEPYIKDKRMKEILENKKIKYLLTGTEKKNEILDENYFNQKLNIPKGAFVVNYIGRHNEIKGYDILKEFAKEILEKYKNVYFVVAGKEGPIEKLAHERWIECGWTTKGAKIMKNSDLFILPNRETYFDLIFLEALSLNCNILCSNTGGNKYFKKYESDKIIYFEKENITDMVNKFEYFYKNLKNIKSQNTNREIFLKDFTVEKFGENYLKLMEEILQESRNSEKI